MKRIIGIVITVLLMLTLCHCGKASNQDVAGQGTINTEQENTEQENTDDTFVNQGDLAEDENADDVASDTETSDEEPILGSDIVVPEGTPYAVHGQLSVSGSKLLDKNGDVIQLYGMSTHGLAWFPQYVCEETFQALRDEWNTNCVRLALYTYENGGYCTDGDRNSLKMIVDKGVTYATELGMYVIIDWHVLNDRNPLVYKDEAIAFFDEISKKYANQDNVIYEICNEPNGASWADVKAYANEVIPVIRNNDPNAVIIVGTPNWSQNVNEALASPLDYENILYALHFYAATHTDWLRDSMASCIEQGLPVIVSEFGICDASGNGNVDINQANEWRRVIEQYQLSFLCWNLANKDESSSVFVPNCSKLSGWTEEDLSIQGRWIKEWFLAK